MKKVKLIWIQKFYDSDGYLEKEVCRYVEPGEFEEVSDEDYNLLRIYLHILKAPAPNYDWTPRLVLIDELPALTHLETIKAHLKMESEKKELQEKKKAALTLKKKKEAAAKKKALYESLKKEFKE